MATPVELIKEQLSIIDVVTPYVRLVRAGKHWRGLSPFAKEKTPSFYVSPDRGVYYCFSTNQGGDIFTFIEKVEGLTFQETLRHLAERAGVSLQDAVFEKHEEKDRLTSLLETTTLFFEQTLQGSDEGKAYIASRGISPDTLRSFRLGFAKDDWRSLLTHLETKGYTIPEMSRAGVIKEAEGKAGTWYDRFRNRIIFPIRDVNGRVIGFSGRTLSLEDGVAKYLNSPETPLFKKSHLLYGIDMAKSAIRERDYTLLVEGQMDLVLAHQAGFRNTVALSGTAFSEEQLSILFRFSENLMLALDADKAGTASAWKNAIRALRHGMKVKIARLPEGKDPADIVREDKDLLTKCIKESVHAVDFFLGDVFLKEKDTRRGILRVEETVLPLIAVVKSPLERDHFVRKVAQTTGLSEDAIREGLLRRKEEVMAEVDETTQSQAETSTTHTHVPVSNSSARLLPILALLQLYPEESISALIRKELTRIMGTVKEDIVPEKVFFEAGQMFETPPDISRVKELIRDLELAHIRERIESVSRALRRADVSSNTEEANAYAEELHTLTTQLRKLTERHT